MLVRVLAAHQDDWLCRVVQTWASQGGCWLAVWQVKHGVLWTYRRDGWSIQNPPVSGKGQKWRWAHFLWRCFQLTAYALCPCCRDICSRFVQNADESHRSALL